MTVVACQQLAPRIGDLSYNTGLTVNAIREAVMRGASVVVLPELATSGYMFQSPVEARQVAVTPGHPVFTAWREAASGRAVVVGGFCEQGGDGHLYNSAAVIDSDGVRVVYRKTHLWDREKLIFRPGSERPPVVDTPAGRIGVLICYDMEFPEMTRALALAGADLITVPTNWPLVPRPANERPPEVIIAMAAARTNHVFIACCDRAGPERGQLWTEGSAIINADGWVEAIAGTGRTVTADLQLDQARTKTYTPHADALKDRRPDLYEPITAKLTSASPAAEVSHARTTFS
jgi:5-aminopentanamidase